MKTKGSILVVDDTLESLKLLTDMLAAEGFDARPADSGELALAAVAAEPPELILLDLRMPGMDGLEILRRLRARTESRDIPVVFVSASTNASDRVASLKLGAVEFLSKPIEREELLARVETHLELRRLRVRLEGQTADLQQANEKLQTELLERQLYSATLVSLNQQAHDSRLAAMNLMDEAVEARHQMEAANLELRREIAERQQTEVALRESEAHYRAVMESTNDAIIISDSAGVIEYWNHAAERMFGYGEREIRGQSLAVLNPDRLADGRLQDIINRRDATDSHSRGVLVELVGRRQDGTEFPMELSLSEWSTPEGGHFTEVIHDITARKRAEQERTTLEAQYRQVQKMESVGRLAGGIAHDFNNMLAIINGYTDLALRKLDPAGPMYADLKEVTKAARRSAELVRQLLAFARQQVIVPKILDINEAVEGMLKLLRGLVGEDVDVQWKPAPDLWPVKMDPAQIDQILANLAVNSRDSIKSAGRIAIESGMVVFDAAYCSTHLGSVPGRYVRLTFGDNGCGIDRNIQGRIFEPFFTTKTQGQGTGLGLSTVYGIVKQNLGFIDVDSEPDKGTTFRIYLPAHESTREADDAALASTHTARGWETVLLVEDEEALLALCKRTLESLGYTVVATVSPLRAIELFKNYPGEIHLLMTDIVMPEMNGRQLQQRIEELRPGLRCLFTSAYTADAIATRGVVYHDVTLLQKPYSWEELAVKVREVLDVRSAPTASPSARTDMENPA